jgi:predicted small integral membrane protein
MIETRIVKIVMVGSLALFAGLVTFDNLTDYQTNYAFACVFEARARTPIMPAEKTTSTRPRVRHEWGRKQAWPL